MISGDNPATVSHVATQAFQTRSNVDVSSLREEEFPEAMEKYTVFGRVKPEQKGICSFTKREAYSGDDWGWGK